MSGRACLCAYMVTVLGGGSIVGTPATAEAIRFYQVGNSLTVDSLPSANARLLEAATGESVDNGFHIRANSSISTIWAEGVNFTTAGSVFGSFLEALPAHEWDHVALQSFPSGGNTLEDDVQGMSNFMALVESNPNNSDTDFYVYAPWPTQLAYDNWENGEVTDEPSQQVTAKRRYYEVLTDTLAAERPGRVFMIPAGEVFFEVGLRIEAGELPSLSSGLDLYRDDIHANDIGKFLAATTVAATISRENPIGWERVSGVPSLDPDLELALQEVVWGVLVERKRSGVSPVGDFNVDTIVGIDDYEVWRQRYGYQTDLSADANGDGVIDVADAEWLVNGLSPGASDINGDGRVNGLDGAVWSEAFGEGEGPADVNGDGVVDAADYSLWRDAAAIDAAVDFNGDGAIDAADFATWQAELGWSVEQTADANGDGIVDAADFTLWRDGLVAPPGTPLSLAVPEPSALCVTVGAAASLLVFRRLPDASIESPQRVA